MNAFINFVKKHKFDIIWIAMAVALFAIDIITKQVVLRNMEPGIGAINVLGSFLQIEYSINDGAAFGIQLKDGLTNKIIWVSISIIGAILLIGFYIYKRKTLNNIAKASLMLMTSGCIGNLIDRAFYSAEYLGVDKGIYPYGGVVDFIKANFGKYSFPTFNIADSCLVIGTFILIIYLIVEEIRAYVKKIKTAPVESKEKVLSKDEIEKEKLLENEDKNEKND